MNIKNLNNDIQQNKIALTLNNINEKIILNNSFKNNLEITNYNNNENQLIKINEKTNEYSYSDFFNKSDNNSGRKFLTNNKIILDKLNNNNNKIKKKFFNKLNSQHDSKKSEENISQISKVTKKNENQNNIYYYINKFNKEIGEEYLLCFFCNNLFDEKNIINSGKCDHYFCLNCSKIYYQQFIENKNIYFLEKLKFICPIYFCNNEMDKDIILNLFNEEHKNMYNKINNIILKNEFKKNNQNNINNIKKYNEKNVLDINNNQLFFINQNNKTLFCPICNKDSLFIFPNSEYYKCLNCFNIICKYCRKKFFSSHMDLNSNNHCKIKFRKNDNKECNIFSYNYINKFLFVILISFISYILLYFGIWNYSYAIFENIFKKNNKHIKNKILKILICLLSTIILFLFLPILIFIIPYFPIINQIF